MSDETSVHVPNSVISMQESCGARVGFIRFYPEDDEMMKKLKEVSYREYIKYRSNLIDAGRFLLDNDDDDRKEERKKRAEEERKKDEEGRKEWKESVEQLKRTISAIEGGDKEST